MHTILRLIHFEFEKKKKLLTTVEFIPKNVIVDVTGEKWRKIYVNARMEWHEMKIK